VDVGVLAGEVDDHHVRLGEPTLHVVHHRARQEDFVGALAFDAVGFHHLVDHAVHEVQVRREGHDHEALWRCRHDVHVVEAPLRTPGAQPDLAAHIRVAKDGEPLHLVEEPIGNEHRIWSIPCVPVAP